MERLVIFFSCVTLSMVNIYMCTPIFGNVFVATEVFCGSPDLPDGCTQKLLGRYQGDAHEGKLFI